MPTVAVPPVIPFTFHVTVVLAVFCTVAVNCNVRRNLTVAEVGEMVTITAGAVTFTNTVFDTSPSVVLTTTGTDAFGEGAFPVAVSCVDETTVVGSAAPSKEMIEPAVNPAPFTVRLKLPAGIEDGFTELMLGIGMIVTAELPVDDGDVVLAARTVTVAGFGTAAGAV